MSDLLKTLAVTAEVMGVEWSESAAAMIADELRIYPLPDVQAALKRCRHELKGKLTIHDILMRLPHGHPGPEEAWATIARAMSDESRTLVWSDEMREAYGVARGCSEDDVAARMAFKETYTRAVSEARSAGKGPNWSVSKGSNKADQERAILEGVQQGKLRADYAQRLLPHADDPQLVQLLEQLTPRLLS